MDLVAAQAIQISEAMAAAWPSDTNMVPTSQLLEHRPLDQYGSWSGIALRHQHGLRWLTRPWVSAQPLVVTESMDINTYPGWCRTVGSDMALSSSPGPEDTMCPRT